MTIISNSVAVCNDGGWKSFAQKSISTDDAIKVKPKICIGNLRVFLVIFMP